MAVVLTIIGGWLLMAALVTIAFSAVARGGLREEERRARKESSERELVDSH